MICSNLSSSTSFLIITIIYSWYVSCSNGFVQPSSVTTSKNGNSLVPSGNRLFKYASNVNQQRPQQHSYSQFNISGRCITTKLWSNHLCLTLPGLSKLTKALLVGASLFVFGIFNYRRLLWPGSMPDTSHQEPLPPGHLGCPFLGTSFNLYSMFSYKNMNKMNQNRLDFNKPRMKLYYAFLSPMIFISSQKLISKILNSEFDPKEIGVEMTSFFPNEQKLLGGQSILFSKHRQEHK